MTNPVSLALSSATGIPEPTLRLLLSVLLAYPAAFIQRALVKHQASRFARNLFNVASGLGVAYFFCGSDVAHSLLTTLGTYAICFAAQLALPKQQWWFASALAFIFNFGYLLVAYWTHASEEYDINWTTPQSVLTLRLIGFAFDFADAGTKAAAAAKKAAAPAVAAAARATSPGADSGAEMRASSPPTATDAQGHVRPPPPPARRAETESSRAPTAWAGDLSLTRGLPNVLELLGYVYFTGSFVVGPQFSFALYDKYLSLDLFKAATMLGTAEKAGERVAIKQTLRETLATGRGYAARTVATAVAYLALTQVLGTLFPSAVTVTPAFATWPLLSRLGTAWMCGKTALTKYLGVWLLTEGACVVSGIAFDGVDAGGKFRWHGLANIYAGQFETATSLGQIIGGFNVNTNNWSKLYLFKRLRFLGNKHLSTVGTLTFLAIWHGFHPGYAYAFTLEFIDMFVERKLAVLFAPLHASLARTLPGRVISNVGCWFVTWSALAYAALGFDLLTWKNIVAACSAIHWVGHWALLALLVVVMVVPPPKSARREEQVKVGAAKAKGE